MPIEGHVPSTTCGVGEGADFCTVSELTRQERHLASCPDTQHQPAYGKGEKIKNNADEN